MKNRIPLLAFSAALMLAVSQLQAAVLITNAGTAALTTAGNNQTIGTLFTVGASGLSVTSLGIWDEGANGLTDSHAVGLWDSTGTLLGSVTVPSGTGGTLSNSFRYAALGTPVTLTAGQSYTLGAYYANGSADRYRTNSTTPTFSTDVSSPFARWILNSSLVRPTNTALGEAYVGPNLEYGVIPEPATWALFAAGLSTILVLRRRRLAV